jgi:hypothetical protein
VRRSVGSAYGCVMSHDWIPNFAKPCRKSVTRRDLDDGLQLVTVDTQMISIHTEHHVW